ncbi:peptidylprolyl isomerase [Altererythrobacter xixiisoli]|uniref:Parvulin-like PPIase n=1 Tax=Croceibacterium xixiisoli TaxID=1476466 RepID=A0A6I4TZ75_9SPHN|nr:SurA N-terminal domain-containing protein [Croceibacterium xixiisoli]MXO99918.1 peptidylprolyl isomerase [Croceibacterium xixiisoli]
MIQMFRSFFSSKFGIIFMLGFVGVIGIAFAAGDISGNSILGGVSGGEQVAVVGKRKLSTGDLTTSANNALEQVRQQDPTATMQGFIGSGGLDNVVDQLISRTAIAEFARSIGLRASNRLVDSELLQIPQFQGADGKFDANAFRSLLAERRLTEAAVRDDLAIGLLAQQLLTPVAQSATVPRSVAQQYASLLREQRQGQIATFPATSYAPTRAPSDAEIQAYYKDKTSSFIRPERRVIRFAAFGADALKNLPAPTDAQIEARYRRDSAQYAAVENRRFGQLVLLTEAAAKAIVAELNGGKSLEQAAREKGLAVAAIAPSSRAQLTTSTSAAVAQAGFATAQGKVSAPARGPLGWYVLRVDAIEQRAERPLASVREEIVTALSAEQRQTALTELTARIDGEFEEGRNLSDVAKELNLTITTTEPVTANGRVYGKPTETVPQVLGPVLASAFAADEGQPQLAELVQGQAFLIYDVASVTNSSAAPLAEIREDVIALWRRDQGSAAAKAAADRVLKRIADGSSLADAVKAENRTLPAVEQLNVNREQLAQRGQVPAPLALFFSMAEGTEKRLEAQNRNAWFVIQVDKINAPAIKPEDPIVLATVQQLGASTGEEYVAQFIRAAERAVGSERNQSGIDAVRATLAGETN